MSNSHPRRPKSAPHHVHTDARHLFGVLPHWVTRVLDVSSMPELSTSPCCRVSLRHCIDAKSRARFPSLPLALPFFFPRVLLLLAGATVAAMHVMPSPWPPSFLRLQPPSTQIDRTTTSLTSRRNPRTLRLKPLITGVPSPRCRSA